MPAYTAGECEAALRVIDAELAALRALPVSGTVGKTSMSLAGKSTDLRGERQVWLDRLAAARAGGVPVRARREA